MTQPLQQISSYYQHQSTDTVCYVQIKSL